MLPLQLHRFVLIGHRKILPVHSHGGRSLLFPYLHIYPGLPLHPQIQFFAFPALHDKELGQG